MIKFDKLSYERTYVQLFYTNPKHFSIRSKMLPRNSVASYTSSSSSPSSPSYSSSSWDPSGPSKQDSVSWHVVWWLFIDLMVEWYRPHRLHVRFWMIVKLFLSVFCSDGQNLSKHRSLNPNAFICIAWNSDPKLPFFELTLRPEEQAEIGTGGGRSSNHTVDFIFGNFRTVASFSLDKVHRSDENWRR